MNFSPLSIAFAAALGYNISMTQQPIRILLVEDKEDLREFLKDQLEFQDFYVDAVAELRTARRNLEAFYYDVVILDLKLPDGNGISMFDTHPDKLTGRTIVITADASIPGVVEAIKKGAYNYLEKPFGEEILTAQVHKIVEMNRDGEQHRSLRREVSTNFTFETITHNSGAMKTAVERARVLARTENTVLIQGETGVGKEVFARSIYNGSLRGNEIFLPVNCAAIPEDLFETEFFGFERGAFTGAVDSYCGRFLQADKGTLFLDEIGELPMHIQAKLLRILDEHVIYRLKSSKPLHLDIRMLAATNRDLEDEVKLGRFRQDLLFRLQESAVRIPPLRERPEDILPLAEHFMEMFNRLYDKRVARLDGEAEIFFLDYSWPGNVRELKNTIKSILPFKRDDTIRLEDLSHSQLEGKRIESKRYVTLDEHDRRYIFEVLKAVRFNISRAAEILGVSRPRLYRRIEKLDIADYVEEEESSVVSSQ